MSEKLSNLISSTQELTSQEITGRINSNRESIQGLKEPIEKLLVQMHTAIENGEYNLIIGMDTSGRLPTLIFDRIIKHIYKQNGNESPTTIFSPGKYLEYHYLGDGKSEIDKQLQTLTDKTKKVLIVDDIVATGRSVKKLAELLDNLGVKFDVATISFLGYPGAEEEMKDILTDQNFFFGEEESEENTHNVYHNREISGVFKSRFSKTTPIKEGMSVSQVTADKFSRQVFLAARQEAGTLADELINWYESEYHQK